MSTRYPIPRQTRQAFYTAGIGQTVFGPADFILFDADDVEVWVKPAGNSKYTLLDKTAYTVAPTLPWTEFPGIFTVTLTAGRSVGDTVWIKGARLSRRQLNVTQGGTVNSVSLETELDRQTATLQELRRDIDALLTSTSSNALLASGVANNSLAAGGSVADALTGIDSRMDTAENRLNDIDPRVSALESSVQTFATAAAVARAALGTSSSFLQIAGYYAAGDGGGALYRRVNTAPSHPGKLQSADGAWWELAQTIVNPFMFGARGGSTNDDTAAINNAVSFFGANDGTIELTATHRLTANVTIPPNVTVIKRAAGRFWAASAAIALTLLGPFVANTEKAFTNFAAGKVTFGRDAVRGVPPEWWGAVGNSVADDQIPLDSAFKSLAAVSGQFVALAEKVYACSVGQFNITSSGTGVIGAASVNSLIYCSHPSNYILSISGTSAQNLLNGAFGYRFGVARSVTPAGGNGIVCSYNVNLVLDDVIAEGNTTNFLFQYVGSSTARRCQAGYSQSTGGTFYGFRIDGNFANSSLRLIDCNAFGNYGAIGAGATIYGLHLTGKNIRDFKADHFETAIVSYGVYAVSSGSLDTDILLSNHIHDTFYTAAIHLEGFSKAGTASIIGGDFMPADGTSATRGIELINSSGVVVQGGLHATYNRQAPYHTGIYLSGSTSCAIVGNTIRRCNYGIVDTAGKSNAINSNVISCDPVTGPATVTIATPGVVTMTLHGFLPDQAIVLTSTGALPTGLTSGTTYYVRSVIDGNSFTVSASAGGAEIATSGSQSGVHTLEARPIVTATAHIATGSTDGTILGNTLSGYATTGVSLAASSARIVHLNAIDSAHIATPISNSGTSNYDISGSLTPTAATLASASTVDLGSTQAQSISISGPTTITSFGSTAPVGAIKSLVFFGTRTLTHNGASLVLPGAVDIKTVAGDSATARYEGSGNWRVLNYTQVGVTTYTPTVSAQSGSLGTNPPTATGSYCDVGIFRFYDITITFPSNYVAGGGSASGWIGATMTGAPAANMDNGLGREIAVTSAPLQALAFSGNSVVRITKSDGTYLGTDNHQLHVQFYVRTK